MEVSLHATSLYLDSNRYLLKKGYFYKFKGPAKSFGYWGLKLLPGIRVIAKGLDRRPRPEASTHLELHLFKFTQS